MPPVGCPAAHRARARMLSPVVLAVLLIGLLVPSGRAGAHGPSATDLSTGQSGRVADHGPSAAELVEAVAAAYPGGGTLGVAVARRPAPFAGAWTRAADARTGRVAGYADNGAAAEHPFPAASMVKLFLAEDVLHRARTGQITLTPGDYRQVQAMIQRSDDPAASDLWVRFGGARAVTDVAARYGLTGTAPPTVVGQWGRSTTTARDLARFLARLPVVAHPSDAGALLAWMRTATPVAADGFDQRFGLFGTAPGRPAVKQGWMCCVGGQRHLHSVAVVGRRVVVLLSEVPRSVGWDTGRAALTTAAAALPLPPRP